MQNTLQLRRKHQIKFNKNFFEKNAWAQNRVVVGIDEVGRGGLAGPVVTAAVILPPNTSYRLLKDSKIMSPQERNVAYQWIIKNCIYGIGIMNHRLIEKHNIWHTTLLGMKKALVLLLSNPTIVVEPEAILVDAMPLNLAETAYKSIPVHFFPIGEQKSSSIAAASILAKVTRDRLMQKMGSLFPEYYLEQHKGYTTPLHKKCIRDHGSSIIHRTTFVAHALQEKNQEDELQLPLFMLGESSTHETL